jgi:hypothetical protein
MAERNLVGFGHALVTERTALGTLAEGDSGVVQNVTASVTITLPATVVGTFYIIRVGDNGLTVTVAPNASDKIMGNGFTSADNKALIFTSQPIGSYVKLVADGVNGWFVAEIHGVATRAA